MRLDLRQMGMRGLLVERSALGRDDCTKAAGPAARAVRYFAKLARAHVVDEIVIDAVDPRLREVHRRG